MRARQDPLVWGAWLAILTLVALVSRSYTPIDETRYLSVAWEMWLRGDWLVPFKNGEPYSHKPPLLFWLMQLGWMLTGVNDWWPRLIAPLLSFASLLVVRRIALELWPNLPLAARLAPWILMSAMLWALFSQAIMFDVLLAFFALTGTLGLLLAARERPWGWGLFGLSIGLGILAKGPVFLLHQIPVALLAPVWHTGNSSTWTRWYRNLLLAVIGGVALALLWAIPASLHGGETYRNAIFWGQSADRMVHSFAHQRPFWWYVPLLPLLLFPWFVLPAVWRGLPTLIRQGDPGIRLLMAWMLPAFLAFSLISGKQAHYLLPELPAFALICARLLAADPRSSRPWPVALLLFVAGCLLLALPDIYPDAATSLANRIPRLGGLFFVVLGLACLPGNRQPARWVPKVATVSMLALAGFHLLVMRPLAPAYDVRPMAEAIARLQAQSREVAHYGPYHAQYQFAGRLTKPLLQLEGKQQTLNWLRQHPEGALVMYFDRDEPLPPALWSQPYRGQRAELVPANASLRVLNNASSDRATPTD